MIDAVEHVRGMKGGAQAQLLRGNDGHYYVVKFLNNPQHPRVLANEWIAARLARRLGLSVPEAVLMRVSSALIERSPQMVIRQGGRCFPCAAGIQFGSRLPTAASETPIYDYLPEPGLDAVGNLTEFAGMLLFDKWTCNCNGRQVIFCRPGPRRGLRVFMIDQGFCFNAGEWSFPDSPLRGIYHRQYVYRQVTGWESFEPWLSRIEELDPESIYQAGDEIPPEWYGAPEDLEGLLETLVRRRAGVRDLLAAVRDSPRHPFENWGKRGVGAGG